MSEPGTKAIEPMNWNAFVRLFSKHDDLSCFHSDTEAQAAFCEQIDVHAASFTGDQLLEVLTRLLWASKNDPLADYDGDSWEYGQVMEAADEALPKLLRLIPASHKLAAFELIMEKAGREFALQSTLVTTLLPGQQMRAFYGLFGKTLKQPPHRYQCLYGEDEAFAPLAALLEVLVPTHIFSVLRHLLNRKMRSSTPPLTAHGLTAIFNVVHALLPKLGQQHSDLLFQIFQTAAAYTDDARRQAFVSSLGWLASRLVAQAHRHEQTLALLEQLAQTHASNSNLLDALCALAQAVASRSAERVFAVWQRLAPQHEAKDEDLCRAAIFLAPKLSDQASRNAAMTHLEGVVKALKGYSHHPAKDFLTNLKILSEVMAIVSGRTPLPNNSEMLLRAYGKLQRGQYIVQQPAKVPAVLTYFEEKFAAPHGTDQHEHCEVLSLLALHFEHAHRLLAFQLLIRHTSDLFLSKESSARLHTHARELAGVDTKMVVTALLNEMPSNTGRYLAQTVLDNLVNETNTQAACSECIATDLLAKMEGADPQAQYGACGSLAHHAPALATAQHAAMVAGFCALISTEEINSFTRSSAYCGLNALAPMLSVALWQQAFNASTTCMLAGNADEDSSAAGELLEALARPEYLLQAPQMIQTLCEVATQRKGKDIRKSVATALGNFAEATLDPQQMAAMATCLCMLVSGEASRYTADEALKALTPKFAVPQQQQVVDTYINIFFEDTSNLGYKRDDALRMLKQLLPTLDKAVRQTTASKLREAANDDSPPANWQTRSAAQEALHQLGFSSEAN